MHVFCVHSSVDMQVATPLCDFQSRCFGRSMFVLSFEILLWFFGVGMDLEVKLLGHVLRVP